MKVEYQLLPEEYNQEEEEEPRGGRMSREDTGESPGATPQWLPLHNAEVPPPPPPIPQQQEVRLWHAGGAGFESPRGQHFISFLFEKQEVL